MDKLLFLRDGMHEALITPLGFSVLKDAVTHFEQLRHSRVWQLELDKRRTLPLNGVSDSFVNQTQLLSRDNESLDNELTAALELGYLLRGGHPRVSVTPGDVRLARGILRLHAADIALERNYRPLLRLRNSTTVYRAVAAKKPDARRALVYLAVIRIQLCAAARNRQCTAG